MIKGLNEVKNDYINCFYQTVVKPNLFIEGNMENSFEEHSLLKSSRS